MSVKKELIDRWKKEPWKSIDKKIYDYCIEKSMAKPAASKSNFKPLLPLLEALPYSGEIANRTDLRGSSFPGANNMDLSNCDFSYCSKIDGIKDCMAKNAVFDFSKGPLYELEGTFTDTSFRGAGIGRAWMGRSVFKKCNFENAKLKSAKINGSDLRGSSFRNADCRLADFQKSDLRGCDFREADLTGAMFRGLLIDKSTDLRGAVLYGMFCEEQRDIYGGMVIEGTDWRKANYDETTQSGNDPIAFDRELLKRIIKEAKKNEGGWSETVEKEADGNLKKLLKDPSFKWHDNLMKSLKDKLNEKEFAEADDFIGQICLTM